MLKFLEEWMLPTAIAVGAFSFLLLWNVRPLAALEPGVSVFARNVQPALIAMMLFLQYTKISPHDLRFRKWHFLLIAFQLGMFALLVAVAASLPDGGTRILVESAMLCFICPTAAAAGVVTGKLGGSLSDTVSYVVLINMAAAVVIPVAVPIVNPLSEVPFVESFTAVCLRVFPLLVLPLLAAWAVRYLFRGLQRKLVRYAGWAFYIWGLTLALSIYLATKALVTSGISAGLCVCIGVLSLGCTLVQFVFGRFAGRACCGGSAAEAESDSITAGQSLGQKNSGFLVWLGYSYMTPVTSVAGGLYSIWQNIINSVELYRKTRIK